MVKEAVMKKCNLTEEEFNERRETAIGLAAFVSVYFVGRAIGYKKGMVHLTKWVKGLDLRIIEDEIN